MPLTLTHPGVYIEEVPSGVRTITGVATSIALFIGWVARCPNDHAVWFTNFAEYERQFGGLDLRTLLPYALKQFYDNGGADAYVIRLAHTDAVSASAASGNLTVSASSAGAWANAFRFRITRRADDATRFKLEVLDHPSQESVVETFENLSMSNTDGRFVETVINGRSNYIRTTVAAPAATPANGTTDLDGTTAGADGTVLDPNSTTPATAAAFHAAVLARFGLGTLTDRIDLFNIVCVPGETDSATIGALQTQCQRKRAFLVVDCAESATVAGLNAALPSAIVGASAPNSAFYFPWVRSPDPLRQGALRSFPPGGYVAGIYARTDAQRGVWKAPAGSDASVNGATALAVTMSDAENGQLNPRGINCLRTLPVYGNVVWGSRTLHGDNDRGSEWKYVPVRRMALFLEESLYRGTQWVVFEPNDEPLWAQIRLNIGAFMQGLFRQGAFQGRSPREAYFVKCDRETTTQTDINNGIVNIHVGFAPLKPAEFVVIRIQQIAGEIPT
jgi:uncharacterized protein